MYRRYIKRLLDIVLSITSLFVLSPVIVFCYVVLLYLNNGRPLFVQARPGKNEKIFKLIKFKTMTDKVDSNGQLLPDADRLTGTGQLMRKLSLDELPQLINVLLGDMSIIGPRPLLIEYLPLYNKEQKLRHKVRPGITGWAQVNGRNLLSWEEKFKLDVYYVKNVTLWLDLKILIKTLLKIIKTEGVTSTTSVSMEKFTGENS